MAYAALKEFVRYGIVKVYFRQVDVVGERRIPESGPLIFVANHSNQFVDPMMLITNVDRVIRFLIAGKSMRRPVIGHFAAAAKAIPVERAQDLVKKSSGTISAAEGAVTVVGVGTTFLKDLTAGAKLIVKSSSNPEMHVEITVKSVESNTSCTVSPVKEAFSDTGFKFMPKVDQAEVYTAVHEALKSGDCIGIFPEGGSHDRTSLLDLKPGVAIMALGAIKAGAGNVRIVPVSLNYFEPYRFRSRVVVEFGKPIEVTQDIITKYDTDKRGAVQDLMESVETGMKSLFPDVQDFEEYQTLLTMRAVYQPHGLTLSAEDSMKLTRQFAVARQKLRGNPKGRPLMKLAREYVEMLQAAGLHDRDVRMHIEAPSSGIVRISKDLLRLVLLSPIALPAMVVSTPLAFINYYQAQKEKAKALANSSVKVKALDVVASYKILCSLVTFPVYNMFLATAFLRLVRSFFPDNTLATKWRTWHLVYWLGVPTAGYASIWTCDYFFKVWQRLQAQLVFKGGQWFRAFGLGLSLLVDKRDQLQKDLRAFAEEMGPELAEDYEKERVISRQAMEEEIDRMAALPTTKSGSRLSPKQGPIGSMFGDAY